MAETSAEDVAISNKIEDSNVENTPVDVKDSIKTEDSIPAAETIIDNNEKAEDNNEKKSAEESMEVDEQKETIPVTSETAEPVATSTDMPVSEPQIQSTEGTELGSTPVTTELPKEQNNAVQDEANANEAVSKIKTETVASSVVASLPTESNDVSKNKDNQTRDNQSKENIKKNKIELSKLPIRQYMDSTIVPSLLLGLSTLAKERPPKPLEFLGKFLLQKSKEQEQD
ncbi:rho GDP dissociation inhibitor [Sarcoptes scabiei]|nr:rho GDP dissociation inhibitor [Sarcoptes scabiei]